jgi:hypothetical protein
LTTCQSCKNTNPSCQKWNHVITFFYSKVIWKDIKYHLCLLLIIKILLNFNIYYNNILSFFQFFLQYSYIFCTSIVDNMLSPSSNDRWVIFHDSIHRHSFHIYICLLSTSIHKERSISVSRRLPQFTVEKKVFEFLNDLKFILYLKYDNFSATWCMTRLPLLPIIYVRAHYIIQLEIHKNTKCFFRQYRPSSK